MFKVLCLTLAAVVASEPVQWPVPDARDCYGAEVETGACDLAPCNDCIPKNCILGDWGEWNNNGDCAGLAERHRNVRQHNNECGTPCNAVLIETKVDIDPECVPRKANCILGPWSEWEGTCSCYTEQKFRTREIESPAIGDGLACTGDLAMTAPCGTPGPPVNCVVGEWGSWTSISTSCGAGRKTRVRRVKSEASNGGMYCTDPLMEVMVVFQAPCDAPAPCKYSDWTDWCGCDIVPGMHTKPFYRDRKREVLSPAYAGAQPCDGVLKQVEGCHFDPPANCTLSEWCEWSHCDRPCGSGQKFRRRKELSEPEYGGYCGAGTAISLGQTETCNTHSCQVARDCTLTLWTDWGPCSEHCGFGQRERTRDIEHEGEIPGKGCNDVIKEVEKCEITPCPKTDCLWDDWLEWSDCTCTCDGGTKVRNRHIELAPLNGGKLCPANVKTEVVPCNTQSCTTQQCTNGEWGQWSGWSGCSATCGNGYMSRKRHVETMANDCGIPALGEKEEYKTCELPPCYHDRDCSFTAWSSWSACSCSCYGHTERSRTIAAYALGNGKPCVGDLRQTESCHPGVLPSGAFGTPPLGCGKAPPPPICEYSPWTPWSPCTATCNGGHTARDRKIVNRPCKQEGPVIPLVETKACNTQECFVKCIDCAWDDWGEWSSCTKCGDEKTRHRHIKQYPNHCGQPCLLDSEQEVAACESTCEKTFYCVWTEWTAAGTCSASCGAATKMRDRHLEVVESATEFLFKGGEDMQCAGVQTDVVPCALALCPHNCDPVDCVFGNWGTWHDPSCEGLCTRSRVRVTENNECGTPCEGPLVETKVCASPCRHPKDCTFTAWSHWQHCMEVTSQRTRFREIDQYPQDNGKPCTGTLKETQPCGVEEHHEVPCVVAPWSDWSTCYKTCGGGTRERNRYIQTGSKRGGLGCTNSLSQIEGCNMQICEVPLIPVDCKLGDWAAWTPAPPDDEYDCTMDGQRFRHRPILVMPKNKGKACVGPLKVTEPCEPPVIDCTMSLWTDWDPCDRTCGGGQQQRHRLTKKPYPRNGGKACPRTILQTQPCNTEPCFTGNCVLSSWCEWGACSATCGSGQSIRSRDVIKEAVQGGVGCTGDTEELRGCTANMACGGDTDCTWGVWNDWSSCSCTCDGGVRRRARLILTFPTGNGKTCEPNAKNEVQPCNTQPCGSCVDGRWGPWSAWSSCSATCVGGVMFRHRNVLQRANECGVPVSGLQQDVMKCSVGVPCHPDVDCQWRDWGPWHGCSASCDGVKRRTREIGVQGHGKGKFCAGPAEEVVTCNPSAEVPGCMKIKIKTNCVMGPWGDWSEATATCGMDQIQRSRSILTPAEGEGVACEDTLAEVKPYNTGPCPVVPPTDCVWCPWNDWGDCTKCAGQSFRTRAICNYNRNGGNPCEPGAARETRACPERVCHKPKYCNWGMWEEWGPCSTTCGAAKKTRKRELMLTTDVPLVDQLAQKNDDLQQRIEGEMNQRMQHLVIAFSAGAASLVVVLSVLRAFQTWTQAPVPEVAASSAAISQERSSAAEMYRSIELEAVE